MNNSKAIRAFLAIEPSPEVCKEMGNIQNSLKRSLPFEVRWVRPEVIHLTLKFFGDISATDVLTLSPVVERYTAPSLPLHLTVHKLGFFPSGKHPRVLWIGLEGDVGPLLVLQKNLEQGLDHCGFAGETRPFRPHLTMGRVKSARPTGDMEKFMAAAGDWSAGSFAADGLGLFQSDLTPQGAVHTRLAWFPFGGQTAGNWRVKSRLHAPS